MFLVTKYQPRDYKTIFTGHWSKFLNYDVFLFLKIDLSYANSADADEVPIKGAFYLGLYIFIKVPIYGYPE